MTSKPLIRNGWIFAALFVALLALVPVGPAAAQDLNAMRASGAMGERYDGYAEARDAGTAGAVKQINAKRNQIYKQRAAEQGISPAEVGKVYAQQIFQKSPSGTFFLQQNGTWTQKP